MSSERARLELNETDVLRSYWYAKLAFSETSEWCNSLQKVSATKRPVSPQADAPSRLSGRLKSRYRDSLGLYLLYGRLYISNKRVKLLRNFTIFDIINGWAVGLSNRAR
jgi:hypothetical protein